MVCDIGSLGRGATALLDQPIEQRDTDGKRQLLARAQGYLMRANRYPSAAPFNYRCVFVTLWQRHSHWLFLARCPTLLQRSWSSNEHAAEIGGSR